MVHVRGGEQVRPDPSLNQSSECSLPSTSPLRIALFSGNYNYVRDGANQTLNRLVGHLERVGVAVRVYAPTVPQPAFPPVGTLISVPSVAIPRRPEYRLGLGLPRAVHADLEAFAPTLVHVSAPDLIGLAALGFAARRALPAVASYHTRFESYLQYYGLGFLQPMALRYLRSFYRRCDQLYVPAEHLAHNLHKLGFNDDVRIWSRGVDRQQFHPQRRDPAWRLAMGIAPEDIAIAFVGRLVREKGLDLLAQIADGLLRLGVKHRLLIVGDGPERAWLNARLPHAVFTGHLAGDALSRAYASADVFLNPSITETFGNVTLEAMASGLPTICALATGSQSIVRHGTTGLLLDPTQPSTFVTGVAQMADSPGIRAKLGLAGRAASAGYDWDKIMAGVVLNYRDAVARHNQKRTAPAARPLAPFSAAVPEGVPT